MEGLSKTLKPVLLIVGDYNRNDFVGLFKNLNYDFELYFIHFTIEAEVKNGYYKTIGKNVFWKEYSDAYDLLMKLNPQKVVFFFLESYNEIALNVACKARGIKTFHLEHGYRNFKHTKLLLSGKRNTNNTSIVSAKIPLKDRIKNLSFYIMTSVKSDLSKLLFLIKYYRSRHKHSSFDTAQKIKSSLRLADVYISFSPKIFEQHKLFDHLEEDQEVYYTGIPYFDDLFKGYTYREPLEKIALFVDHPHVTKKLLGWTFMNKLDFITQIAEVCKESGYKLLVKSHPYAIQDIDCWETIINQGYPVNLIDTITLQNKISEIPVILGFFSTLLMPLASLTGTVMFTFECHPSIDSSKLKLSDFLIDSGVSTPLYDPNDLSQAFEDILIHKENQGLHKPEFINKWMYKFDGRAGFRLREVLLSQNETV